MVGALLVTILVGGIVGILIAVVVSASILLCYKIITGEPMPVVASAELAFICGIVFTQIGIWIAVWRT